LPYRLKRSTTLHKVYYDLHIHTALSPCADDDMTPNDIVGMALLNGLDLIAITDHNSMQNAEAVITAARDKNIIVIPGMEISTAEDVHVLCLFCSVEKAEDFEKELKPLRSKVENRKDIFGNQIIYDEKDEVVGEATNLLVAPTKISFDALQRMTAKYGAAFIPAHIDRESFSVLSNLGFLPPDMEINTLEVSKNGAEKGFVVKNADKYTKNQIIHSSDAHRLWEISERINYIMLPEFSIDAAIDFLR